jgi:membrane protease YdiL (CAAX protease family)
MTEFCSNCGHPLEGELVGGLLCSQCDSRSPSDGSMPDRGLVPGSAWNAPRKRGPIGAIGAGDPHEADSPQNQSADRIHENRHEAAGSESGSSDYAAGSYGQQSFPGPYALDQRWVGPPAIDTYDPDHPPWGAGTAIGVWLASVAAILVLPNISVFVWLAYQRMQGLLIPADREGLEKLLAQPGVTLIGILSSLAAHLVTLAIIWAVVTGFGRRSFWKAPEWRWSGLSWIEKPLFVVGVVVLMFALDVLLGRLLPESKETLFDRLLKTSANVRVVIALLAVFTAPLVEEWVYRGVLYAGLRRIAGVWPSVLVVAVLFAGVHFPQYWGAWAGLIGISILSLTLTIIRARTKSILPCVAVHVVFNAIGSVVFLSQHY